MLKVVLNSLQSLTKSVKSNFTFFPDTCKSQSLSPNDADDEDDDHDNNDDGDGDDEAQN